MLSINWTVAGGWEKPQIIPNRLDTIASELNNSGISCHEGISVVENRRNGKLQAFRA